MTIGFLLVAALGAFLLYLVWGPAIKREEERQSEKFWMETMGWGKKNQKKDPPDVGKIVSRVLVTIFIALVLAILIGVAISVW